MLNTAKLLFSVFSLLLLSTLAFSQSQIKRYLVESIQDECPSILGSSKGACSSVSKATLLARFSQTEDFLVSELISMVIKDRSKSHQRYLNQLAELEAGNTRSLSEPIDLAKSKYNTIMLAAVTNPRESGLLFKKAIFMIYGLNADQLSKADSSVAYGFFQNWLYGLLDARFHSKSGLFSRSQYGVQARYVAAESEVVFQGLDNERIMAKKMEQYIRDCDVQHDGKSSGNDLTVYYYEQRCAKIQDSKKSYIGDDLFKLVDEFFQKAISLDPKNDRLKYNRYTHYYNSAVLLKRQSKSEELTSAQKEILQNKAAGYLSVAAEMAKEIYKED